MAETKQVKEEAVVEEKKTTKTTTKKQEAKPATKKKTSTKAKSTQSKKAIEQTKSDEEKGAKKIAKKTDGNEATKKNTNTKKQTPKKIKENRVESNLNTENKTTNFKDKEEVSKKLEKVETNKNIKKQKVIVEETVVEVDNESNTQVNKQEETIKIEDIKKVIKNKKTIPKEEIIKINKYLFINIIMAVCVITYFLFLNLGYIHIKNDIYVTDIKVFSMCILLFAICLLENAYKKDSGQLAIFGVEMIILAIVNVSLIYVDLMLSSKYMPIISSISFIFAIYYLIKTIVIYIKRKNAYFVNDMKEIIKEEE